MKDQLLFIGASPDGIGLQFSQSSLRALTRNATVVAVDGGLLECDRLGVKADLWVGDGDSLRKSPPRLLSFPQQILLPKVKDESDLRAAFRTVLQRSSHLRSVMGLGFFGGRFDHLWGGIWEWSWLSTQRPLEEIWLHGPDSSTFFLSPKSPKLTFSARPSQIVSVFSLSPSVKGLKMQGLRYSLPVGVALRPGTHGLSNEVVRQPGQSRSRVAISLEKGHLLGVIPHSSESAARAFVRSRLKER